MINILLNILCYIGLVVVTLVGIGTCLLLVCGIISIVKEAKDGFKK